MSKSVKSVANYQSLNIQMKYYYIFLLLILINPAFSQQSLSISQAQKYAIEHKQKLKSDKVAQEIAQSQIREQVFKHYPQLNASADFRYNAIRQTTVLPAGFAGTSEKAIKFGRVFNQTVGVEATQSVFDKKLRYEVQQAELNYELSQITQELDEAEISLTVIKSYLNALINEERLKQLEATLERLKKDKEEMVIRVEKGSQIPLEIKRIQTNIDNTISEISKQQQAWELSLQLLKYNLGMELNEKITLSDNLISLNQSIKNEVEAITELYSSKRLPSYQLQKIQIQLAENQMLNQKAKLMPTVSAYGYLAMQGLSNNLKYFGDNHIPWYGNSYFGVKLNWNINPYWENKLLLPQNELRIKQAQIQLAEREEDLQIQIVQAKNAVKRAKEDKEIQARNIAFAQENLEYIRTRFQGEVATAREVIDAENDLSTASENGLIAGYNYWIAWFELRKATGNLE
jgi:outer membrane protein TolC